MELRERFEDGLEAWTRAVARQPWPIIIVALALSGAAATQLPRLRLDTSNESYLQQDDPVLAAHKEMQAQFGRDQVVFVGLEPAEVFDLEFLAYLRELHEALEDGVPYVDRITSLVNIRSVEGRGDELIVGDLLEEFPSTAPELAALRRKVLSTPAYLGGVISRDGGLTTIVIELDAFSHVGRDDSIDAALAGFDDSAPEDAAARAFLSPEENSEAVEAVKAIARSLGRDEFPMYISGSAMLTHEVSRAMAREAPVFFAASLAVIGIALFALFRRLAPCFVSLGVVVLSVVAAFGTAAVLGQTMSILSQILPSFLLAVGVGYAVHVFAIYFQRLDAGDSREAALVGAMRHSGPPIVMTALTTAVGLASFLAAVMPPMRDFGLAAMLGVCWTLAFNLTLLPALICVLPMRGRSAANGASIADGILLAVGTRSARHPWKVVAVAAILAVVSASSALRADLSNNPIRYLAPDDPYRVDFEYLDERLRNTMSIELYVDSQRENGLYEPSVMNQLDAIAPYAADFELAGRRLTRTNSVVDIVKETHQALNANDPAAYKIPQQRALLAQELFLFENSGSDDLERFVDPQFRKTRYSIGARFDDGNILARIVHQIQIDLDALLGPEIDVVVTGSSTLIARTIAASSASLIRTYALALAIITPLMMLLIGSLRAGLVSMAPNLLPILLTMGLIPLLRIPLDIFTMMIGCIAIGLAVDDTLHFIHGFRARLADVGDPYRAIEETLETTGRALLFTSIVLCAGFLVLTLSSMSNLRALGGLTALAIAAAFVLDIIVTPALLMLVYRKRAAAGSDRA